MCGIAGFIDTHSNSRKDQMNYILQGMTDCLKRRGPDEAGYWIDENYGVALGHRRLSIIDLSPSGAQPMISSSGRFVIVFNGEIYNFQSIAKELAELGIHFKGTSDTEVFLEAIETFGLENALKKAAGMFAFAVWDRKECEITLARDRMGEKPIYYASQNGKFFFASTPSAIKSHPLYTVTIDRNSLSLFFRTNYIPAPYSIYEGMKKLEPGCCLKLSLDDIKSNTETSTVPYWQLRSIAEQERLLPGEISDREAIDQLESLLLDTVKGQMISDVPLGAFLSGGIDSSLIVALMSKLSDNKVKTYTIGFNDIAYDESKYAREVAKCIGTDHTERILTDKDALDIIPDLPSFYDEPFADSSQIPTYLVSKLAREQVTVALTGDGGDEIFCGYNRQVKLLETFQKFGSIPSFVRKGLAQGILAIPSGLLDSILRKRKSGILADQVTKFAKTLQAGTIEDAYFELTQFWGEGDNLVLNSTPYPSLLYDRSRWLTGLPKEIELLWIEAMTSLPDDMLVKVDRAGMATSLESRVPLLDHRIVSFAWSLPQNFLLRDRQSKWILRQLLYKYVPKELIERPKSGFGVPIDRWLQGPLKEWAESLLDPKIIREQGYLDADLVQKTWNEHQSGRAKLQSRLWGILMFQSWLNHEKVS